MRAVDMRVTRAAQLVECEMPVERTATGSDERTALSTRVKCERKERERL